MADEQPIPQQDIDPDLEKEVERIIADQAKEEETPTGEVVSKEVFLKRVGALTSARKSLENQVAKLTQQIEEGQQSQLETEGKHSEVIVALRDKNKSQTSEIESLKLKIEALRAGIERRLDPELIELITGDTSEEILLKADNLQELWEQKTSKTVLTDGARGANGTPGRVVTSGQNSEQRLMELKRQRMKG